jgi:subtilisin family serine protease
MDRVRLTSRERTDLEAFQSTGWGFLALIDPDIDWAAVRALNPGSHLFAGLLARQQLGGLVVLRDRLVISLAGHADPAGILKRYVRSWEVGAGRFEVQVPLPNRHLQQSIDHELEDLNHAESVPAYPSLLYRVASRGRLDDIDTAPQWQWDQIHLTKAWALANDYGAGMRAAVIDLGFYLPADPLWTTAWQAQLNPNGEYVGADLARDAHGTFCAGLIGALKNAKDVNGAAPECKLILVAIPETGVISDLGLVRAINLCVTGRDEKGIQRGPGADVISCSISSPNALWPRTSDLECAIDRALNDGRGGHGTPIVWATNNVGGELNARTVQAYDPLLTVSGSNGDDELEMGQYGHGLDLVAPGIGVGGMWWNGESTFGYKKESGASAATPCVAGVAVLIAAIRPDLRGQRIVELIQKSAKRYNGWKPDVGWGRLDAEAAVRAACEEHPAIKCKASTLVRLRALLRRWSQRRRPWATRS